MIALQIELPMDKISDYCQKWHIEEFAVFGSVLRDDFHENSDLDVMVTFSKTARPTLFTLVEMTDELEMIVSRKVDIVTRPAVEASDNYIRRDDVLNTAQVIYAS